MRPLSYEGNRGVFLFITNDDPKVAGNLTRAAFNDATTKLKAVRQQEVVSVYEKSGLPLTGEGEE